MIDVVVTSTAGKGCEMIAGEFPTESSQHGRRVLDGLLAWPEQLIILGHVLTTLQLSILLEVLSTSRCWHRWYLSLAKRDY
jgi:hypothetical protein